MGLEMRMETKMVEERRKSRDEWMIDWIVWQALVRPEYVAWNTAFCIALHGESGQKDETRKKEPILWEQYQEVRL